MNSSRCPWFWARRSNGAAKGKQKRILIFEMLDVGGIRVAIRQNMSAAEGGRKPVVLLRTSEVSLTQWYVEKTTLTSMTPPSSYVWRTGYLVFSCP